MKRPADLRNPNRINLLPGSDPFGGAAVLAALLLAGPAALAQHFAPAGNTAGAAPAGGAPFAPADELLAADRAFAAAASRHGAQAWRSVWAEHGLAVDLAGNAVAGPLAAAKRAGNIADERRRDPAAAGMLWPNALGYTAGRWRRTGGAAASAEGRPYLTIWQRIDGEWRVALDLDLPEVTATGAARDFDFWLGDWSIEQRIRSGQDDDFETYDAHNRVRRLRDTGGLVESLEGDARFFWLGMEEAAPFRGASVRVFYPATQTWRIFWIDTLNPQFGAPFSGAFSGDAGEFLRPGRPEGPPPGRIRFERRSDVAVDWQLDVHAAEGDWQPLWLMRFRRDGASPRPDAGDPL